MLGGWKLSESGIILEGWKITCSLVKVSMFSTPLYSVISELVIHTASSALQQLSVHPSECAYSQSLCESHSLSGSGFAGRLVVVRKPDMREQQHWVCMWGRGFWVKPMQVIWYRILINGCTSHLMIMINHHIYD